MRLKITVFNGSPRGRQSNTHRIVSPLLEGARQAGGRTEEIFLVEHDIRYCRGCFSCWTETPGRCIIEDDMSRLINIFIESDYAGMATPVYGMFMTAILKNFNERLLPLNTPHFQKDDEGRFYHEGRLKRLPRPFVIANSGFPGEHNFDLFRAYMAPQNPVLEVYRSCGGVLEGWPDDAVNKRIDKFYDALREAGRQIVNDGCVSKGVVARINAEIIGEDEFMAGVNKHWDSELKNSD